MKYRALPVLLALGLLLAPSASAASFADVKTDAWYAEAVDQVTDAGLMNGATATAFSPDGAVTRGMAATVLWRRSGSPAPKAAAPFSDVKGADYYADAVAWAAENGVVTGFPEGTFRGGAPVTREQLAMFLLRYATLTGGEVGSGVLTAYPDGGRVSAWAKDGMSHTVGLGLITGRDDGRLDPAGGATRAQLAVILQRLMTPAQG